jgi:CheY-like chemotaxis protein
MARILLVDDEETVRGFLKRGLEIDGHAVVTANDGSDGLDRLNEADGGFDLMLTDIRMPLMDGIALALAAKRDFPDLTILLMTGFADQRERARRHRHRRADEALLPGGPARHGATGAGGLTRPDDGMARIARATDPAEACPKRRDIPGSPISAFSCLEAFPLVQASRRHVSRCLTRSD